MFFFNGSNAAINGVVIVAIDRIRRNFFGKIIKKASGNKDEIILSKINLAENKKISDEWGFMRNRRVDTYKSIVAKK